MPTLPLVRSTAQAIYPVTRIVSFDTGITVNANGSEQRWKRRAPLFRFVFPYAALSITDRDSLVSFVNGEKGAAASNWQAALGGTTYQNLAFDDDVVDSTEVRPGVFSLTLKFSQVQNRAFATGSPAASFPTITGGVTTQLPYGAGHRSLSTVGRSESGPQYSYSWFAAGLSGFPTRALRRWTHTFGAIPDADVATLETFFIGQQGRFGQFDFTDPGDGVTYGNTRFDTDTLEIRYLEPGKTSISFPLLETNN